MNGVKKLFVLPVLILTVAVGFMMVLINSKKPPEKQEAIKEAFLVETTEVKTTDMNYVVKSQGTVEPKMQTILSAEVSGKVVALSESFVAGGLFSRGDVLVQLEQSDYITDLKAAEAELARAQAALEEEQARGKVAAEEWKTVSRTVAPELGLRKPQLAKEIANLRAAEAQLERAKRNLERTVIRAPYDGLIRSKTIDLGQFVSVGSQLGTLYGTDIAEVRMPLSDSDLAYLELSLDNSKISLVTLSSEVAGKTRKWQAHLVRNEGVLDSGSRVIYAVAEVRDPYLRSRTNSNQLFHDTPLKFGRFVRAEIQGDYAEDIVVLPRSVLRLDGSILVVDNDNKLHIRSVNVQKTDETSVYIGSGLEVGEQVIVSAVPNPVENMAVRFVDSGAMATGNAASAAGSAL